VHNKVQERIAVKMASNQDVDMEYNPYGHYPMSTVTTSKGERNAVLKSIFPVSLSNNENEVKQRFDLAMNSFRVPNANVVMAEGGGRKRNIEKNTANKQAK